MSRRTPAALSCSLEEASKRLHGAMRALAPLAQAAMSHTSGEKLLAVSHKLFKLATALVKGVAAQDERTPSSALKGFLDELHKHFRCHVAQFIQWYHNQGKEGMTASRIKRQTRTIPNLISQIEELDVVIIKMANLTKKEDASAQWGAYIRRTRALDFRFIASKIEEEQENAAKKRKAKAAKATGNKKVKKDVDDGGDDDSEDDDDDDDEEDED